MNPVLITGAAGFIGMHCAKRLLAQGVPVVGIDNLNNYYDVALKQARLNELRPFANFRFVELDVADRDGMARLFAEVAPAKVLHLAAQAGVRYSIDQPDDYTDSNLLGFGNILQGCRKHKVEHLVYASSSSVYGGNTKMPFAESDAVDHPISYYAATKKANELMAHTYSHLYSLPTTGLRFFTVYGPWGRPDMAPSLFMNAIMNEKPISVFNHGCMQRDFTFIDDIVKGILKIIISPPVKEIPYEIYNIGNSQPVELMNFIQIMEKKTGKKAILNFQDMQPGDVITTYADTTHLEQDFDYKPSTTIEEGIKRFYEWFINYYKPTEN